MTYNKNIFIILPIVMALVPAWAVAPAADTKGIFDANNTSIEAIHDFINSFEPIYPDDRFALVALQEALLAVREGNYGWGACLVSEANGTVVERGHNRVFYPYFRSDMHAEMDVLTRYEERMRAKGPYGEGLVMYLSAEPGPMSLVRMMTAGIEKMYYLATDTGGGIMNSIDCLPPVWRAMAIDKDYSSANCSPELKDMALLISSLKKGELDSRVVFGNSTALSA